MKIHYTLQNKVTTDNAQLLANYLLTLEQTAIDDRYQQDAKYWIQALQDALQRYQQSLRKYPVPGSNSLMQSTEEEILKQQREAVYRHTLNLIAILTTEACKQVELFLVNPHGRNLGKLTS